MKRLLHQTTLYASAELRGDGFYQVEPYDTNHNPVYNMIVLQVRSDTLVVRLTLTSSDGRLDTRDFGEV